MSSESLASHSVLIRAVRADAESMQSDRVAVEEPLEIRLTGPALPAQGTTLAITMRTPGADGELACGFLLGEGIIRLRADVEALAPLATDANVICIRLRAGLAPALEQLKRNFYVSSSCGVCGKASIAAINALPLLPVTGTASLDEALLRALPARLRAGQPSFAQTGGLHAVGLFRFDGTLSCVYEDVGRHNAMDKVTGAQFLAGNTPLSDCIAMLSGRASFELLQKAMAAGISVVAAVGAPSSLAIDLAQAAGITLIGFLRPEGYNIYTNGWRLSRGGGQDT
jgi:FdhD protein